MLVSYKWLQTYFEKPLPHIDELVDLLTMGVFEIEGVEKKGDDTILDVKVLPDRAAYGYSHRYIAQEIGALINQPIILPHIEQFEEKQTSKNIDVSIIVHPNDEASLCNRYIGRLIEHVKVESSPDWLKNTLEVLDQKSINTIVDLTNYVMIETGQPLHAFDADKVEGNITVRKAKEGEEITLLDGKTLTLSNEMLVIADDVGPLALAGVKGGKRAEISNDTKNIIIEAASFDSTTTRKTSQKVGIRNESSKRFENGVTSERAGLAMAMITSHIANLNPEALIGNAIDVYPNPISERVLEISMSAVNTRLGLTLSGEEMTGLLNRCGLPSVVSEKDSDVLVISVPPHRPDLHITEDIAEEIGRVNGYNKVVGIVPEKRDDRIVQKNFFYVNTIRKILADIGFSEVYTYSLIDKGDMAIINPLTVERACMRNSISELLSQKFLFNMRNLDLLGQKDVRLFELGKIFSGKNERTSLAFGVSRTKLLKNQDPKLELIAVASHLCHLLGSSDSMIQGISSKISFTELKGDAQISSVGFVAEIELDQLISELPDPKSDADLGVLLNSITDGRKFKTISPYPFSSRDVAVFVPGESGREGEVINTILGALKSIRYGDKDGMSILAKTTLFDVFTKQKEGEPTRTSYAYRLVFQASDRTLTEEEIAKAMQTICSALTAHEGWEVR